MSLFYSLAVKPWTLLCEGFRDLRQPPPGNRPCLDVLRCFAVSLVLVYHLESWCQDATLVLKSPFVRFGWSGVDLFCILSGLLIGTQLWKELRSSGTVKVGRFVLRRGLRIWPLYYFLILFLLAERLFFGFKRPYLWLDATFLANYYQFFHRPSHEVAGGWSLCLEEQFYLLIPILLMVGAKILPKKLLPGLILIWFVSLPVIRHFALQGVIDPRVRLDAVYYYFHTHSDSLAIGVLISWILIWTPNLLPKSRLVDAALLLVFLFGFSLWYNTGLTRLYSIVAICYGTLTFLLLRIKLPSPLRSKAFYIVSRLSYGVYLIHPGVFKHVMPYHVRLFGNGYASFLLAFVLWGTATLVLAFVTFSFIELPFLKLRDRLLIQKTAPLKLTTPPVDGISLSGHEAPLTSA